MSNGALGEVFIRYATHDQSNRGPNADSSAYRCNNVLYIISVCQRWSSAWNPDDLFSSSQGGTCRLTSTQKTRNGLGEAVRAPNYALVVVMLRSKCTRKLHKLRVFPVERRYTFNLVREMHKEQKGTDSNTPYPRTPAEISDIFSGESLK